MKGEYSTIKPTLFIVRGLPGNGKSTFAKHIWIDQMICEADKYFIDESGEYKFDRNKLREAHNWCRKEVEDRMIANQKNPNHYIEIVVSNTFTTEKEIQPYTELAEKYGYQVVSLIVENRHGNKSIHGVPESTMDKMRKRFEIKL